RRPAANRGFRRGNARRRGAAAPSRSRGPPLSPRAHHVTAFPAPGIVTSVYVIGIVCAVAASALFNGGIALQALEARRAPQTRSLRLSLLQVLLRRPRRVLGLALGLAGDLLQVVGVSLRPFVVI